MKIIKSIIFKLLALIIAISAIPIYATTSVDSAQNDWSALHISLIKAGSNNRDLNSISKLNILKNEEWKKRVSFCLILAKNYLEGKISGKEITDGFIFSPHYQSIMNTFTVTLIAESIKKLEQSKLPLIGNLMKEYKKAYGNDGIPLFRLTGAYVDRDSPTEEKGGFHRGSGSIFMDISRTSSGEFLFIFTHELFHALDSKLFESSRYFSQKDILEDMIKTSKKYSSKDELTASLQKKLDLWIYAGLNRGLFAEWRAWSFGFDVYQRGVKEGLWNKIPFVEEVLNFKNNNETIPEFTYRYLNERSPINDPVFNSPLFKEAIQSARENFVAN